MLSSRLVIWGLVAFVIFFPTFLGGMSLLVGQKILYLLYPCLLAFSLVLLRPSVLSLDVVCVALFGVFVLLSLSIFSKVSFVDVRMFASHMRYAAYFVLYFSLFNFVLSSSLSVDDVGRGLVVMSLFIVIFVAGQFLAPEAVQALGVSSRDAIDHHGIRIGGPIIWSYGLGFVVMPMLLYLMYRLVAGFSVSFFVLFLILLLMLVGGQSKATYLVIMMNLVLLIFVSSRFVSFQRSVSLFAAVLFFSICIVVYIAINLEEFGNLARFHSAVSSGEADVSTKSRLYQLSFISITLEYNPWFGYPLHYQIIENAYGYYLYNYGLLGLILYFTIMLLVAVKSWKIFFVVSKREPNMNAVCLTAAAACHSLSPFVFSLANSPLDGHKTAYFYWSFFAIYFAVWAKRGVCGVVCR